MGDQPGVRLPVASVSETDVESLRAPGQQRDLPTAGGRGSVGALLALQRAAGNAAVVQLLRARGTAAVPAPVVYRAGGSARIPALATPLQRKPDGPPEEEPWPEEPVSRPILWPEEAEGERNEPCFDPDSQAMIKAGATLADAAAAHLVAMPPDLETAVNDIAGALNDCWERALGAIPGETALGEAKARIQQAGLHVGAYVAPVSAMLEQLALAAQAASADASEASTMMTRPRSAEEEPLPCFEDGQKAVIARAVALANNAATELGKRPPDYPRALATLRNAATMLGGLGGEEPGQAMLKGAVDKLYSVVDGVQVYLTPVAKVVAEAAADVKAASAQARQAADMARPGPYAAGGGAEAPEGGG